MSEQVLVIRNDDLGQIVNISEPGIIEMSSIPEFLYKSSFLIPRSIAEEDNNYKQIIPYTIFSNNDSFFSYKRLREGTERRLWDRLSIGIGGHINETDCTSEDPILNAMTREMREEVHFKQEKVMAIDFVGLITDFNSQVGNVHLGLAFIVSYVDLDVRVRESSKLYGDWEFINNLNHKREAYETWSRICIGYISESRKIHSH